ncbi:peptidase G2 autoproteolytic cleavage domain-containing protein [Bacillus atrophaeus]|uniref:peptidase G2 autoproteolytic cleavage domain-containing protein n=1 Tax=Bacillus atrophaeus TaxID=1452 RepID=UPI0039905C91
MERIGGDMLDLNNEFTRHKNEPTAHTSEQIDHGGFSMSSVIKNLSNRLRNLIVNADGTNVKEVVDARIDAEGEAAALLKDRLDKEYNKLLRKINRVVHVDDFGADPTGVADSTEAFRKAIGNGRVELNLSAGEYVVKGVTLPSWTSIVGQGIGVTTLKLHEDTPASGSVITNADHVNGNRNISVKGMSLDWNPERQGGVGATGGLNSSCLTFAKVKFGVVREVEAINPGLHGFDASAPTYNISDDDYTKDGSRFIWFDKCFASGYGDDGITTHYSENIFITNSYCVNPRGTAHALGQANSNGIEVDDGSKNVWVIGCYTEGNVRGVEVKAHAEWPAPSNIHILAHDSYQDVRAYDLRHIGHHLETDPWSETARDVTLIDCTAREPVFNSLYEGLEPKALAISAYQRVLVANFRAQGDPSYDYKNTTMIAIQYKSRKVDINGIQMTGFKRAGSDIHIYGGTQKTDDVSISNFTIHDSAPVGIALGGGVYNVDLVNGLLHTSEGTAGITSPNTQANILAVRAIGYTNAAVLSGYNYAAVPNNIKGPFRGASTSGHPLTKTSAILASTGLTVAKGERNLIAGVAGGATTEGSRNGVLFSWNSHTTGEGASAVVMCSKNVKNNKSYALVMGHGEGSPSEANKKIELNAKDGTIRSTGPIESVSNLKDLAEYFESADGKKIEASYLVALEGDKIRKADKGDKILGVVSKTAGLVLGGAAFYWNDRYLRDEFGGIVTREIYDDGEIISVPAENPNYDPTMEYTPREEREEWHVIGLLGQVFVKIDETVEVGGSVSAVNGIATKATEAGYGTVMAITTPYDSTKGYGVAQMIVSPQH